MKAIRAALLALFACWAVAALADVAVPPLTGRVVDQTGTLSSSDVASLTARLKDLESRKGSQIAVLIVPTTQPETIEQFSIRVADAWKIGRQKVDDGAILVVAKNDRRLRIEVGYGLEGSLTDATTHRIIDEDITPKFRSGDFAGGINAGVDHMIRIVDGEQLPAVEPPHWQSPGLARYVDPFNPFVIVVVLAIAGLLRSALGRLVGSTVIGAMFAGLGWLFIGGFAASAVIGAAGFLAAFFLDMFQPAYGPGGGWSSGSSSGGGWSSSGSSDGGFSGGGGGFGGGGASGSW
jgi:uncharacterized protein